MKRRRLAGDDPGVEWPEDRGPRDGSDVADAVVTAFRERCEVDIFVEDVVLVFVPDPPVRLEPLEWARTHGIETSGWKLRESTWGRRSRAWIASQRQAWRDLIALFLSLRSTTLSIIVVEAARAEDDRALGLIIADFLDGSGVGQSPRHAGLFFDMGTLMSYETWV